MKCTSKPLLAGGDAGQAVERRMHVAPVGIDRKHPPAAEVVAPDRVRQ